MNVYICCRWKEYDSWMAALIIIAANSEEEAIAFFTQTEDSPPADVILMVGVIAIGHEPRVLYDDYNRR